MTTKFQCFNCGKLHSESTSENDFILPCGCQYDWIKPDKIERVQSGNDYMFNLTGSVKNKTITTRHVKEDLALSQFINEARSHLKKCMLIEAPIKNNAIMAQPSISVPDFVDTVTPCPFPDFYLYYNPPRLTSGSNFHPMIYKKDTDVMVFKHDGHSPWYACHKDHKYFWTNGSANAYESGNTPEEAAIKFIAYGKPVK